MGNTLEKIGNAAVKMSKAMFQPLVVNFEKRRKEESSRTGNPEEEVERTLLLDDFAHLPRGFFSRKSKNWKQVEADLSVVLDGGENVKDLEKTDSLDSHFRRLPSSSPSDAEIKSTRKALKSSLGDNFPDFGKSAEKDHALTLEVERVAEDVLNMQAVGARLQAELSGTPGDVMRTLVAHPEMAADLQKYLQFVDLMGKHEDYIKLMGLKHNAVEALKENGKKSVKNVFWGRMKPLLGNIVGLITINPVKLLKNVLGILKQLGLIVVDVGRVLLWDAPKAEHRREQFSGAQKKVTKHKARI